MYCIYWRLFTFGLSLLESFGVVVTSTGFILRVFLLLYLAFGHMVNRGYRLLNDD